MKENLTIQLLLRFPLLLILNFADKIVESLSHFPITLTNLTVDNLGNIFLFLIPIDCSVVQCSHLDVFHQSVCKGEKHVTWKKRPPRDLGNQS
jgi:hypothetical protein